MFVVVSPNNIDDLEEFYNLATDLGMHEISIYEIIAVGRWLDHEDDVIGEKDIFRLEKFQKAMNLKPEVPELLLFPILWALIFSDALQVDDGCMLLRTEK